MTKELVANGELAVVAIATEQHRERTSLWADWQGIEWPILWDPFNLTGSFAVPNAILVDAGGTVVTTRIRPDGLAVALEELEPFTAIDTREIPPPQLAQLDRLAKDDLDRPLLEAVSRCLWSGAAPTEADLRTLRARASGDERRGDHVFWSGVAERLAYDAAGGRGPGFARAVAAWHDAHALVPSQYIWRRRIQQYGPRLDQPYDFYAWMPEALETMAQTRPSIASNLSLHLTPTEMALEARPPAVRAETPDGTALMTTWDDPTLGLDIVVVRGTTAEADTVCLHVAIHDLLEHSKSGGSGLFGEMADTSTIDGRAATASAGVLGGSDTMRFTQDLPLERWNDDTPLPAYLTYWVDVPDSTPRFLEHWIDIKALARR